MYFTWCTFIAVYLITNAYHLIVLTLLKIKYVFPGKLRDIISKWVYGCLLVIVSGYNDILCKRKWHWIWKYVYHGYWCK